MHLALFAVLATSISTALIIPHQIEDASASASLGLLNKRDLTHSEVNHSNTSGVLTKRFDPGDWMRQRGTLIRNILSGGAPQEVLADPNGRETGYLVPVKIGVLTFQLLLDTGSCDV